MKRDRIASGTTWEPLAGVLARRVGQVVYVSGTTATDVDGHVVGGADPYARTVQALRSVRSALERICATLDHVVRNRMYVTNIAYGQEIGRAHGAFFGAIRPATTMVEVSGLIRPEMMVEIEAAAIIE